MLNLFLQFTAILAAIFLLLYCFVGKIPMPQFACDAIENEIKKTGVFCDFEGASVSFSGEVELIKPSVRLKNSPFPIFAAKKIELDFNPLQLLYGRVEIQSLSIDGGSLCDSLGDIKNAPRIKNIILSARKEGDWWILKFANFKVKNLNVSARGLLNSNFDFDELVSSESEQIGDEEASQSQPDKESAEIFDIVKISKTLDRGLGKIGEVVSNFSQFKDPYIDLNFELFGGGENMAEARFYAENYAVNFGKIDVETRRVSMKIAYSMSAATGRQIKVRASANEIKASDLPSCENVNIRADLFLDGKNVWLENVIFTAAKIDYKSVSIDNVSLKKDFLSKDEYGDKWRIFAAFDKNRLGGVVSFNVDGRLRFDFASNVNPRMVLKMKELSKIHVLEQFDFPDGIVLNGALYGDWAKKLFKVSANLESDNCVIMKIPVERVSGRVEFDTESSIMHASEIKVQAKEGWNIDGEMIQNIENNLYLIKIIGTIKPMAIANFMAPWWTKIMGSFTFNGEHNFPTADVSVEGVWGKPENIWCTGTASGANAKYNGVDFDGFSVNIWVNPTRITLYDVSIFAGDRKGHAFLEWLYGKHGITTFDSQRIFMESNLNSAELVALGGDDAREVLDVVRFHCAPRITLNAVLRNPHNNPSKLNDEFNLNVFAQGKTQIEFASLENLSFSARSNKIDTNIDKVSGIFCKGIADAAIDLTRVEKGMLFDGIGRVYDMNQLEFFQFLDALDDENTLASAQSSQTNSAQIQNERMNKSAEETETEKPVEAAPNFHPLLNDSLTDIQTPRQPKKKSSSGFMGEGGKNGKVNLDIRLSGDTRNFTQIKGNGYVTLINKDLIELNLFGLLSRALSAVKLPFGSFDLTTFSSPFSIAAGEVKFSKIEIGGPVMSIRGAANYNFIKDDLSAALTVIPFAGVQMPIISSLVSLVNPISNVAGIKISGSLSDPKFGISINPLNMFDGDKKILKEIRDSL